MYIEIDDNRTIKEVQEEFHAHYPFLKLEFFKHPHGWTEPSSSNEVLKPEQTLSSVRKKHVPGLIEIYRSQKTGMVEQHFHRRFNLNVQIYRLHGDQWIQTAGTDELTLEEQNEIGRKTNEPMLDPDVFIPESFDR